jgi:hypothetical protein
MHIRSVIALALVATGFVAGSPANALTCSDQVVQARGEPSRFEVIAKAKARGNWRAQVRALPHFGALYANWSIAASADYACTEEQGGIMCTAMARPCRE